jgi:hypothetical protein
MGVPFGNPMYSGILMLGMSLGFAFETRLLPLAATIIFAILARRAHRGDVSDCALLGSVPQLHRCRAGSCFASLRRDLGSSAYHNIHDQRRSVGHRPVDVFPARIPPDPSREGDSVIHDLWRPTRYPSVKGGEVSSGDCGEFAGGTVGYSRDCDGPRRSPGLSVFG